MIVLTMECQNKKVGRPSDRKKNEEKLLKYIKENAKSFNTISKNSGLKP